MSQYPDPSQYPQYPQSSGYPQQPSPYAVPGYYSGGMPNPRPASVTAVAIIGIILGSLSMLCAGPGFFFNWAMFMNHGRNPLAPQLPPMESSVVLFSVFQTAGNFVLSLIMLICCIAALKLKPFARTILVPWAYLTIAWAVMVAILTLTWTMPEIHRVTQAFTRQSAAMQGPRQIGEIFGAVLTSAVMCVVPLGVLIWWSRPHVKAAFAGQVASPGTPYPGAWPPAGGQM